MTTNGQPAVFLDRDGVLIEDVHYLSKLEQVSIYPDVPEGLKRLKERGFLLILVSNQSGVARGFFYESFVKKTHQFLNDKFAESAGVRLDGMYYCPHHVNGMHPFNVRCNCRKPATGMIEEACSEFSIDLSRSFMIGDKACDILLARNASVKGIHMLTGHGESEQEQIQSEFPGIPSFCSFSKAIDHILNSASDS